jgi:hypothetical protein
MKKNIFLLAFVVIAQLGFGQYATQQALYSNLPQARYYNAGIFPEYAGYFSIPGLSGYGATISNSGFSFSDLFVNGNIELNNFVQHLSDKNNLNFGLATDIIGFGFKVKRNYFSLNITSKSEINLGYNRALFDFILNGNANYIGKDLSLDGFAFDASSYLETGIGYARDVNEKLNIGGRAKVLIGVVNINGDFNGIKLHTDENDYSLTATSDFSIKAYGTFLVHDSINNAWGEPSVFNPSNIGFGLDLGATYQYSDKLTLYGSIVDLGFINWKDNGEELYNDGSKFKFDGFAYSDLEESDDDDDDDFFTDLGDSLASVFELKRSRISYRTQLKTRLYLGGRYELNKFISTDLLIHGRVFNNNFYPMIMAGAGFHLNKWLTTKVTYAGVNSTYDNIGAGLILHLGVFQLYGMVDNVYGLTQVDHARYLSGSFGINFTFKGNKGEKKLGESLKSSKDKNREKKKKSSKNKDSESKSKNKDDNSKDKKVEPKKKSSPKEVESGKLEQIKESKKDSKVAIEYNKESSELKDMKDEKNEAKAKSEVKSNTLGQEVEAAKIELSSKVSDEKTVVENRVVGKKVETITTDVVAEIKEVFTIDSFVQPIIVDSLKTTVLNNLDSVTSLVLNPDSSVVIKNDSSLLLIKNTLNIDSLPEIQIPNKIEIEDSIKVGIKKEILKEDE